MPITWTAPPRVIAEGCERFSDALIAGLGVLAQEEAAAITEDMRANAPWEDRTGEARAKLRATVELGGDVVTITAGGYSDHNIYLELGTVHMAPRPIIMPALERAYAPTMERARRLIGV